jgi:hypothetical protein
VQEPEAAIELSSDDEGVSGEAAAGAHAQNARRSTRATRHGGTAVMLAVRLP